MIVYHADTKRRLQPGMTLALRKDWSVASSYDLLFRQITKLAAVDGISQYGANSLLKPETSEYTDTQIANLIAEYLRLCHFPNLPSRFQCAFASRSVEGARKWIDIIAKDGVEADASLPVHSTDGTPGHIPIYALSCSTAYIADGGRLEFPHTQSYTFSDYPASMIPRLYDYWRSVRRVKTQNQDDELSDVPMYEKEELLVPLPARVLYRVV